MANYNDKYIQVKLKPIIYATVVAGGSTTTFTASSSGGFSAVDYFYIGDTIKFTSGAANGLTTTITNYIAATNTFTIESIGITIANGVTFDLYDTLLVQDDLHNQPFSDLSILIQPTSITTYSYDILYGDASQTSNTITGSKAMVTYTDRTQIFPINQPKSNWARQANGSPVVGYPIYVKIIHKSSNATLFKVSIVTATYSNVV